MSKNQDTNDKFSSDAGEISKILEQALKILKADDPKKRKEVAVKAGITLGGVAIMYGLEYLYRAYSDKDNTNN